MLEEREVRQLSCYSKLLGAFIALVLSVFMLSLAVSSEVTSSANAAQAKRIGWCHIAMKDRSIQWIKTPYCLGVSISGVPGQRSGAPGRIVLGKVYTFKITVRNIGTKPFKSEKVQYWNGKYVVKGGTLKTTLNRKTNPWSVVGTLPGIQPRHAVQRTIHVKFKHEQCVDSDGNLIPGNCDPNIRVRVMSPGVLSGAETGSQVIYTY